MSNSISSRCDRLIQFAVKFISFGSAVSPRTTGKEITAIKENTSGFSTAGIPALRSVVSSLNIESIKLLWKWFALEKVYEKLQRLRS